MQRIEAGTLIHYPTMIELNCKLLVVYSVGGEGVRLAAIALDANLQPGCVEIEEEQDALIVRRHHHHRARA